jgi:hypothetical protein
MGGVSNRGHAMKFLTILLTLLCSTALAGGAYYNPLLDGEGVVAFERGDEYVFWFFTYTDDNNSVPPVVSPAPPAPSIKQCRNCPVWYMGVSNEWEDGVGTGTLYLTQPLSYPEVRITNYGKPGLADLIEVGVFIAVEDDDGEGYTLDVLRVGHELDADATLYTTLFHFNKILIE